MAHTEVGGALTNIIFDQISFDSVIYPSLKESRRPGKEHAN